MGLLDGGLLGGNVGKELGVSSEAHRDSGETYSKPLTVSRFDSFGTGTMQQGEEVELARVRSPAGIARRWGFGTAEAAANQGYAYGHFMNANGEAIHGILILKWENSTGRETQVATELATEDMDTSNRYDREQQPPVPEQQGKNKAEQDEHLVVSFEPETDPADITNDYAIDAASSECRIPATEYDVS